MMVLTVPEIRAAEEFTMQNEQISSLELMERAGSVFAAAILSYCPKVTSVYIFCGPGNNGGDGLVVARHLASKTRVVVVDCSFNLKTTSEFLQNRKRLEDTEVEVIPFNNFLEDLTLSSNVLLIDALFGIGLSRPLSEDFQRVITIFTQARGYKVALDLPSGLFCDRHTSDENLCVKVHQTLTFQFMKLAFLMPENYDRVGEVKVLDIGLALPPEFPLQYSSINWTYAKRHLQLPHRFAHKGSQGHGLLIAGCRNMPGAALLAAKATLRAGAGKLTLHAPQTVLDKLIPFLPEAICSPDKNADCFSCIDDDMLAMKNAVAVGPGIGKTQQTISALKDLISYQPWPWIIDADAINILAENKAYLTDLLPNTILTPHYKEFERLVGKANNDFERLQKLSEFAKRYQLVVVLKGAYTAIADSHGSISFNFSGNPGLATAGSGDVLTGVLLAFLSQGYHPLIAARLGVYLHGVAAEVAVQKGESTISLIASDLHKYLGEAINIILEEK